jgi:hypothetical protein
MMNGLKKAKSKNNRQTSGRDSANAFDPRTATPADLCDAVRGAMSAVSLEDRIWIKEKLLSELQGSRLNVGSILLLLGIHADTVEELTPSDVGYLVRYIRMNSPDVLATLRRPLAELFEIASRAQRSQRIQESKRAA